MNIDIESLFWFTFMLLLLLHWWRAQQVKEVALKFTQRKCKELDLQLLDSCIYLRGFWLKRDDKGQIRIWRSYNFEFSSTGDERYKGRVMTLGKTVTDMHMDPYRVEEK